LLSAFLAFAAEANTYAVYLKDKLGSAFRFYTLKLFYLKKQLHEERTADSDY
jgi:hypothetical protein